MDSTATDTSLHSGTNTITAMTTPNLSTPGQWAAQGGLITNWTAVPLSPISTAFKMKDTSTATATGGENTTVLFGANISTNTPPGSYVGTVLYTGVAKP
jgi:hypothetical protein